MQPCKMRNWQTGGLSGGMRPVPQPTQGVMGAATVNYATMSNEELADLFRRGDKQAGAELGKRAGW